MTDDYAAPVARPYYAARPHGLAALIGTGGSPDYAPNGRLAQMLMHVWQRRAAFNGQQPDAQPVASSPSPSGGPYHNPVYAVAPVTGDGTDRRAAMGLPYSGLQFR